MDNFLLNTYDFLPKRVTFGTNSHGFTLYTVTVAPPMSGAYLFDSPTDQYSGQRGCPAREICKCVSYREPHPHTITVMKASLRDYAYKITPGFDERCTIYRLELSSAWVAATGRMLIKVSK